MRAGSLDHHRIDQHTAVFCGTSQFHLIVHTGEQISAAQHTNGGLAVVGSTGNVYGLGLIGYPDHIPRIVCRKYGRQQEALHLDIRQGIVACLRIVGISGPGNSNGVGLCTAVFCRHRDHHVGRAAWGKVGVIDADLCTGLICNCADVQLLHVIGNLCGIEIGGGAESRRNRSVLDGQTLELIVAGQRAGDLLHVGYLTQLYFFLSIGQRYVLAGYLQFFAGNCVAVDLKGQTKDSTLAVEGIVKTAVVHGNDLVIVEVHLPGRTDLYCLFGQGQHALVVVQHAVHAVHILTGDGKGYRDGITGTDHIRAVPTGRGADRCAGRHAQNA